MCKNIFGTDKAVVLDSGFCVKENIKEIELKVVYAESLINNHCYCPKGIPGDLITIQI